MYVNGEKKINKTMLEPEVGSSGKNGPPNGTGTQINDTVTPAGIFRWSPEAICQKGDCQGPLLL